MATPRICDLERERLENYLLESDEVTPEESNEQLFLHFLDDLLRGLLTYKVLAGELTDLDMLIDHKFWILGLIGENAWYSMAADRPEDELPGIRVEMRQLIQNLPGEAIDGAEFMDQALMLGLDTAVVIGCGLNSRDQETMVVYHSPIFSFEQALGILKDTLRIDDALKKQDPED